MSKPTKKQIAHARRVVADPGFLYAVSMHALLSACYGPGQKELRHAEYRKAGLHESLAGAERRARKAAKHA